MAAPQAITFEWGGAKLVLPKGAKIEQIHPSTVRITVDNQILRYRSFTTASSAQYQPPAGKKFVLLGLQTLNLSWNRDCGLQLGKTPDSNTGINPPSTSDVLSFIVPWSVYATDDSDQLQNGYTNFEQIWLGDIDIELEAGDYFYSRAWLGPSGQRGLISRLVGYEVDIE